MESEEKKVIRKIKEEHIKPMIEGFLRGDTFEQIALTIGNTPYNVEDKLRRMGYILEKEPCGNCKEVLARFEARIAKLEEIFK